MIIKLPFAYWVARAMPNGKLRDGFETDIAEFEVPEARTVDAPCVTRWHQLWKRRDPQALPIVTRFHGGRLFERCLVDGDSRDVDIAEYCRLVHERSAKLGIHFDEYDGKRNGFELPTPGLVCTSSLDMLRYMRGAGRPATKGRPAARDGATVVAEDRQAGLVEARRTYAASIVVIDGKAWTAARGCEPMWHVDCHGGHKPVEVNVSTELPTCYKVAFRADRKAEAMAFAAEVAALAKYPVFVQHERLVVHAPHLLEVDEGELLQRSMLDAMVWRLAPPQERVKALAKRSDWRPGLKVRRKRIDLAVSRRRISGFKGHAQG